MILAMKFYLLPIVIDNAESRDKYSTTGSDTYPAPKINTFLFDDTI